MTEPRGLRNNNPGNIRKSEATRNFSGLAVMQDDPEFWKFKGAEWGIRALAKILLTYQRKHGLKTVGQIMNRWAPPSENPTDQYAIFVAGQVGVSTTEEIDLEVGIVMQRLVRAIIHFEQGQQPYSAKILSLGIALATGRIGL
jgi:hypothetical protein